MSFPVFLTKLQTDFCQPHLSRYFLGNSFVRTKVMYADFFQEKKTQSYKNKYEVEVVS